MASFLKTIICFSFLRPSLLPTQTTRSSALAPITRMISLRATRLPVSQLDATLMSIKMASMSMASCTAVKKMMKEAGLTILKKYLNAIFTTKDTFCFCLIGSKICGDLLEGDC